MRSAQETIRQRQAVAASDRAKNTGHAINVKNECARRSCFGECCSGDQDSFYGTKPASEMIIKEYWQAQAYV
jgi:hypothetical protein